MSQFLKRLNYFLFEIKTIKSKNTTIFHSKITSMIVITTKNCFNKHVHEALMKKK